MKKGLSLSDERPLLVEATIKKPLPERRGLRTITLTLIFQKLLLPELAPKTAPQFFLTIELHHV